MQVHTKPTLSRLIAYAAPLALLAGCGGEGITEEEAQAEIEKFDSISEAFSVDSCATATANESFTGKIDPAITSPRSYNTCYKGYVVDIDDLLSTYTGNGSVMNARFAVHWGDTPITNQTDCEAHTLRAIFYKWQSGAWAMQVDESVPGTWVAAFGGSCTFEANMEGMTAGSDYRIAATARTPGGSTRKVTIGTYKKMSF